MTTNRAALLTKVHKVLKKHYKPVGPPAERTILEHMLYACCLENSRYEAADESFAKLRELFFDWNEVRVTTVMELSEVMTGVPDAAAAAQRLKRSLQSVFETVYDWTLEHLAKQNIGKAEKELAKLQGATPFVQAYVIQNGLGGHAIPVSTGAIEVLHAVGAINEAEADKLQVPGIERAIPKNKGGEFGSLLQQIGADFFASPGSNKLRAILAEIDGDFKERLAKRAAKQEARAAEAAVVKEKERIQRRADAKVAREKDLKEQAAKAAAAKSGKSVKSSAKQQAAAAAAAPPPPVKLTKAPDKLPAPGPKPLGKEAPKSKPAEPVVDKMAPKPKAPPLRDVKPVASDAKVVKKGSAPLKGIIKKKPR